MVNLSVTYHNKTLDIYDPRKNYVVTYIEKLSFSWFVCTAQRGGSLLYLKHDCFHSEYMCVLYKALFNACSVCSKTKKDGSSHTD